MELELETLYNLKVGDVISMNKPKDGNVKIFVGRQPWFTGKMGAYKKNIAVCIEKQIYEEAENGESEGHLRQENTN